MAITPITVVTVSQAVATKTQATVKATTVSAAVKTAIVNNYQAGMNFHDLARQSHLCNAMIKRILNEQGVNIGVN
jgi:hypothetical protein